ncbi:hypothetical protein BC941DRAFT_210887 [Chlamydoabsidia padenii]|nr:hypothetical protein BC941DRAFT_210887 [Chlamydoabsidia padenii]
MSSIEWRNYLLENNIIEGPAELKKRDEVLVLLRSLIPSFIRQCAKENNTMRDDHECQLVPFGSFSLGGHTSGGDIDLVLLAPISVRRRDFYEFFPRSLKRQPTICEVELIARANVPIIKCVVDSIHIDISFVRLQIETVPTDIDLLDDSYLKGLDNLCLTSMDGPRVSQFILKHVYPSDLPVFRLVLQCVKHWANQRCLYGKPMGFLSGGAWTILLVKTYLEKRNHIPHLSLEHTQSSAYQTHSPHDMLSSSSVSTSSSSRSSLTVASPTASSTVASSNDSLLLSSSPVWSSTSDTLAINGRSSSPSPSPSPSPSSSSSSLLLLSSSLSSPSSSPSEQTISFSTLLNSFFCMWSTWNWPDPVILTKSIPISLGPSPDEVHSIEMLDTFKYSLLPIVTPCYPVSSAAPFVNNCTLTVITNELQRVRQILQCDDFTDPRDKMDMIFKLLHIIRSYKNFLKVTVSCDTFKSHEIWSRRMANYLPRLVELVNSIEEVSLVRPFTKSYKSRISYKSQHEKYLLRKGLPLDNTDVLDQPGSLYLNYFLLGLDFHDRKLN